MREVIHPTIVTPQQKNAGRILQGPTESLFLEANMKDHLRGGVCLDENTDLSKKFRVAKCSTNFWFSPDFGVFRDRICTI